MGLGQYIPLYVMLLTNNNRACGILSLYHKPSCNDVTGILKASGYESSIREKSCQNKCVHIILITALHKCPSPGGRLTQLCVANEILYIL